MPVYEYKCPDCDGKLELIRPISRAAEDALCPECDVSSPRAVSHFAAVSRGKGHASTPVGGSGCANCGTTNCASCGG